jgi:hypothetical protein
MSDERPATTEMPLLDIPKAEVRTAGGSPPDRSDTVRPPRKAPRPIPSPEDLSEQFKHMPSQEG